MKTKVTRKATLIVSMMFFAYGFLYGYQANAENQPQSKKEKLKNYQKRRALLLNRRAKLLQQIQEAQKRLGPTNYNPPFHVIPKTCHEPVRRFFGYASTIHIKWHIRKYIQNLKKKKFPGNEAVMSALYMLKINKTSNMCFQTEPKMLSMWARETIKAKTLLSMPGLKQSIRKECMSFINDSRGNKEYMDLMGDVDRCTTEPLKPWYTNNKTHSKPQRSRKRHQRRTKKTTTSSAKKRTKTQRKQTNIFGL